VWLQVRCSGVFCIPVFLVLFLQFSDHLLPRRHKALQNLETAPLQIDFEHILFSLQTIDVAIIRCNLTLARVCSQTFIQSCLSSYLFSFMYFLEGANESCYLLPIQSQTMKLELPLTYEIWTPEVIACDDFLICLIWALPFLFHCILAYIFFLSSACDKKSMPVPPGYDRMFIRLWGTGHDLLVISCNFSV